MKFVFLAEFSAQNAFLEVNHKELMRFFQVVFPAILLSWLIL